jgi:predicted nucleotidyltransferase
MLSLNAILEILRKELPFLQKKFLVKQIGVFGSYARNEASQKSDIDILVEFIEPVGFIIFMQLEEHLTEKLGIKVDLATPNAIKIRMRKTIFEDMIYA